MDIFKCVLNNWLYGGGVLGIILVVILGVGLAERIDFYLH